MDVASLPDYEKRLIREAMLDAQTEWLDEAERAETPTLRTLATIFADVFRQEADKFKTIDREGWATDDVSSIGADGNDEPGASPAFLAEG